MMVMIVLPIIHTDDLCRIRAGVQYGLVYGVGC
jgi:hypothetical protein